MKVFSALLLIAFCVGAAFSSALPEEDAVIDTPAEVPAVVPAQPAAPAEKPSAPAQPVAPPKPRPGPKPRPTRGPKPPQDPTIAAAKELERKLEKALRESRGKLEKLEKVLGEPRAATLAKVDRIKDELVVKAKEAKKEGKMGLRKLLIKNVIALDRLKVRISKLK